MTIEGKICIEKVVSIFLAYERQEKNNSARNSTFLTNDGRRLSDLSPTDEATDDRLLSVLS